MTIFELIVAQELTAYYETMQKDRAPFLGEELFPNKKKLGLDLKWLKGSRGLPVVLKPSAFDAKAIPRDRLTVDKISAEMPFFKESLYIDEETRQELNKVLETGNQTYIDTVVRTIFDDQSTLIDAARAQRERMRMMALTTGRIDISANGQAYSYDYGIPEGHKKTVTTSWSDTDATIIEDIRTWMDTVENDTGVRPVRAVCSGKTWGYLRKNTEIKNSIFVLSGGQSTVSDARLRNFLVDELGLQVAVNDKRYKNEAGDDMKYVADDVFVLFPEGALGNTWFGTTPEESDLMTGNAANVSIVDTGVAVTTTKQTDPVNVETKVSMITLPDFPTADQIFIADVSA